MIKADIRWKPRFSNFEKALLKFQQGIEENETDPTDIIKEGIIQRFESTHELARKVLKDYLLYEGIQNVTGSRTATREAFKLWLISEGKKGISVKDLILI